MGLRDSAFCESGLGAFVESPLGARGCPGGCFYIGRFFTASILRDDGGGVWQTNHADVVGGVQRPIRINSEYVLAQTKQGAAAAQAKLMRRFDGTVEWTKTIPASTIGMRDLFMRNGYAYIHFVTNSFKPRVQKFALATGTQQWDWTSANTLVSTSESAIWVDSSDVLHVGYRDSSSGAFSVDKVNSSGSDISTVTGDSTQQVTKLAMDDAESFYIVAGVGLTLANLSAVSLTGTTQWNPFTTASIGDMVYRNGWIYVCENGASASIYRVDPSDGSHDLKITPSVNSIYGVDSDEDGNIYVVIGSSTDEVRRYTSAGSLDWNISTSSDPHGIRVLSDPA